MGGMKNFNSLTIYLRLGLALTLLANEGSIGFSPFDARVSRMMQRKYVVRMDMGSTESGSDDSPVAEVKKEIANMGSSPRSLGGGIHTSDSSKAGSGSTFSGSSVKGVRVAYQGSPGAYSQQAVLNLLGHNVATVGYSTFEDVFDALSNDEVSYSLVPIQNSLGGSIHINYDLMLRHYVHIIAEYELRVEHCLMALPGTKKEDLQTAMSHVQALAQCHNYLKAVNVTTIDGGDTAGSAKRIAEENMKGVAAVASRLAAETYGLEVLDSNIEDDDVNYTRFLLLSKTSVKEYLTDNIPSKTSIVFSNKNQVGALHKVFSCFALRDIDLSKIESRPMNSHLLAWLRSSEPEGPDAYGDVNAEPHFKYVFYVDFLDSELSTSAYNSLSHLRELAPYLRVLGSYPRDGRLVGEVKEIVDSPMPPLLSAVPYNPIPMLERGDQILRNRIQDTEPLQIGVIGFGTFGQYISKLLMGRHKVRAMSRADFSPANNDMGIPYYSFLNHEKFFEGLDVVLLSVSIVSFESVLRSIPTHHWKGKLVVDVLSVKRHPKQILLDVLPLESEILCTHPMFGPDSGKLSLTSLPFVYDKVRIYSDEGEKRCNNFLSSFSNARCKMVEMSCELHDELSANSQFVTHLVGRILGELDIEESIIDTMGFKVR